MKKDGKKIKKAIQRQEGHARSVSAASIKSANKSCHQALEKQMNTLDQFAIDNTIITLNKQRFVLLHTFRKTEIPALHRELGYKHTFCQYSVSTKKLLLLMFSSKRKMFMFWSTEELSSFFRSPLKLCRPIGGLRQIAV